jgi:translation initiation factor 5B
LKGAIGIKIVGQDLGRAIAGTPLLVVQDGDDIEDVMDDVQSDVSSVLKALGTDSQGVTVQASTLGALEALLQFLREECKPPIPVGYAGIGPIHKKDIMRCNINNEKGKPEFATILAFDVPIDNEAQQMADENHVRIFTAEIIYHLFDQFTAYMNGLQQARKTEAEAIVVFPCVLKIMPQHIFNKKDPIVFGVEVVEGSLRLGTMLTIPSIGFLDVGKVTSIENKHKEVNVAKKGASVAVKIVNESNPTMTYGRQFDHTSSLYSKISRQSIDALKDFFKE